MGYYITLHNADFTIPADKLDEAYRRMCALNDLPHEVKRGGRGGAGVDPADKQNHWFSWMDWNYPETCKDAGEILEALGFELADDEGALSIEGYDSKAGQEDLFIEAIADLMPDGSFLEWRGEDGAMWRLVVKGGRLVTQTARLVYEEVD